MGKKRIGYNSISKKAQWSLDVNVRGCGRKRETFEGSAHAADQRLLDIKSELKTKAVSQKAYSKLKIKTFGEAIKFYLSNHDTSKSDYIFKALMDHLGGVKLTELKEPFIEYLHNFVEKLPYENSTKIKFAGYANTIVETAMDYDENILINPINRILRKFKKNHPPSRRNRILSNDELSRLVPIMKKECSHLVPIFMFALVVPSRKGELVNLKRSDLDMVTNDKYGFVYFVKLQDYESKNRQPNWKLVPPFFNEYFASIPQKCDWVFYRESMGHYVSLGDFKRSFNRALKLANIEDFKFHDTRHHATTKLRQFGADLTSIQEQGNWSTTQMVSNYHRTEQIGMLEGLLPAYEKMESSFKLWTPGA